MTRDKGKFMTHPVVLPSANLKYCTVPHSFLLSLSPPNCFSYHYLLLLYSTLTSLTAQLFLFLSISPSVSLSFSLSPSLYLSLSPSLSLSLSLMYSLIHSFFLSLSLHLSLCLSPSSSSLLFTGDSLGTDPRIHCLCGCSA